MISSGDTRTARAESRLRFAVGLALGLALAAAAIWATSLLASPGSDPAVVVSRDDLVDATATPAWPFRSEWLTPQAGR